MNKTLLLAKALLRNGSGKLFQNKKNKTKIPKNVLYIILLAVAFIPVISAISVFISFLYDSLAQVNQEGVILGLGLTATSLVIFIFGIFYVINVFYFSQDIDHLLPLPLRPSQILSGKFIVTILYEYLTELFLLMPILITYGVKSGAGFMYYVYALLIFITLPILPLVISSLIAMIVMRFTNIAKNKDRYRMFGGIIAIVFALSINIYIQKFSKSMSPEQLQDLLLSGNNGLLGTITKMFPSAKLSAIALIDAASLRGLIGLLGFLALSALAYFVFNLLGERLYFKGVMGISESSSKRERVTDQQLDKQTNQSSTLKALLFKELKLLFRTPVYFLNCVLMCFLWPIIICIPFITSMDKIGDMNEIGQMLNDNSTAGIVLGLGFAVFLFLSGSNPAAPTSVSREGTNLYVIKYLPVPYAKVLLAKALSGSLLSMISIVLVLLVAIFLVHLPVTLAFLLLILGIPAVLFGSISGTLIDVLSPKLNWDNEQKAVKQNMNSILSMILNLIVAVLVGFAAFYFKFDLFTMFIGLLVLFIIINVLLYRLLTTKGVSWLSRIEI